MSKNKFYTLIPLFVFIAIFLGTGIYLGDFYQLPSPVAIALGIMVAFLIYRAPVPKKVDHFIAGCGDPKIITMCIIYLLAGAFATVTKAIGGVDMMVNIGLTYIPVRYLAAGIFMISCFLSVSIGTSVGSIVALGPIVVGLAEQSGISMALLCGALLGGSMFGDNLSFISDTTIAATQTLGCEMKDKFKANFKLVFPAALITLLILFWSGRNEVLPEGLSMATVPNNYWLMVPYLLIIVLAILGVQVFIALLLGILVAGAIGFVQGDFTVISYTKEIYSGFTSMTEIFLLSMLTGGLAYMVEKQGGIDWILSQMKKRIRSAKSAQWGIGLLVGAVNFAVANNTVSILVSGSLAKDIATEYHLPRPRVASILDLFACIVQGILPYGAQVLILLSFTNTQLGYMALFQNSYYIFAVLAVTVLYFLLPQKNYGRDTGY
ncbi:Na+/H+ antiporter NhaC family protein [Sinomicrobium weinanense]|uniref:Na+/H+ antiporter NhaC family protein n=1 Tax=Sinomicrobium weinanense TaxID=2842200 RepID=A0A926JT29_9FLAO|nr:Na+/H+ antiporter NhaC family protein [Sinomicrobium weinanense]MBC9796686.1 Na+/H+ antiporter NhaC family protein [Sinomicrobium weinanense]MBU3123039.1 Na+/H+ antiporter NhaC family protein [Sinomicrobium weinanense]